MKVFRPLIQHCVEPWGSSYRCKLTCFVSTRFSHLVYSIKSNCNQLAPNHRSKFASRGFTVCTTATPSVLLNSVQSRLISRNTKANRILTTAKVSENSHFCIVRLNSPKVPKLSDGTYMRHLLFLYEIWVIGLYVTCLFVFDNKHNVLIINIHHYFYYL